MHFVFGSITTAFAKASMPRALSVLRKKGTVDGRIRSGNWKGNNTTRQMGKQESLQSQQEWDKNTSAFDAEICDKRARRKKALVLVFLILCLCVCRFAFLFEPQQSRRSARRLTKFSLLSSLFFFFPIISGLLRALESREMAEDVREA